MRRVLLVSAAITFAIACTDNITEPVPDRPNVTPEAVALSNPTVAFATTTTEDGLSISTDKDDYAPGDTVHFTGSGWEPGEVLDVRLDDDPAIHPPHSWTIAVGPDGAFHDSTYIVDTDDLGIIFTLTATSSFGRSVSVTFTDAAEGDVTQVVVTPVAVSGGFKLQVQVTGDVGKNQAWRTTAYLIQAAKPDNGNAFGTCIDKDPDVPGPTGSGNPPPATGTQSFEIPGPFAVGSSGTVWIRMRALACGTNNANDGQWDDTNGQFSIPSKLAFITPTFSRQVTVCSPQITVQTQDATSAPSNPISIITVNLSSNSGGGTFYSDNTCSAVITTVSIATTGNTASFYYKDSQTGTPTLTAATAGLTSATQQEEITAAPNAAPVVNAGGPYSTPEGTEVTLSPTVTDPDAGDVLAYTWAVNTSGIDGTGSCSFNGTENDKNAKITCNDDSNAGTFTLSLSVDDGKGHTVSDNATLTVTNENPTATFNTPAAVNEGGAISLSLSGGTDPSSNDAGTLQYAFDCGTGYGALGSTSTASCPTDDNGSRNVKGKIVDKDNGSTEYTASVTIINVAPTATFSAPSSVNEGDNIALSLTNPFDPSTVDVAAGLKYAFDCGDGAGYSALSSSTTSRSCATTDDASLTVKGKIQDKDGELTEYNKVVQVLNVDPVITWTKSDNTPIPATVIIGTTLNLKAAFTDPGADSHIAQTDCGSGYGAAAAASSPVLYSCTFASIGPHIIKVRVQDDDGGADEETHTVTVMYNFSGFFAPVDRPNTMNISKVGQAIPLKWRLTDADGRGITGVSAIIQAYDIGCALGTSTDVVEEYAGNSGLQDLGDGYYQYNWKTPSSYLNSCKKIALTFAAGGMGYTTKEPVAFFTFKK